MPSPDLPPLIRAMLRPDFYPHETAQLIRLVQTHVSYLLLTGRFAYKVKKALDLGFLDFRSLERRRHFCEEELRLNRRGAPGIYLEVVAIAGDSAGGFHLGADDGEAVEYAVKMRQFAEEGLFIRQLDAGRLSAAELEELAGVVADYHAAAPRDVDHRFGDPAGLRASIVADLDQVGRFVGRLQTRPQQDATREFVARFIAAHADQLLARARDGHVRECHGDLHLGNVCRWEGRTLLFDCIEFEPRYRWIDTMHDAAFVAMDLEARGRADLANAYRNAYAERSGDWEAVALCPLYECRYAIVRAKVNSLLAEEAEVDEARRSAAAASARTYYGLASRYAAPRSGRLVVICGPSGSGKSTVGRQLARRIGAVHIRSDAVRKHLAEVPLQERGGADVYSDDMTERTYARLLALGIALAREGWPVILDARYSRFEQRSAVTLAAERAGVSIRLLYCTAPPDVLRERLRRRQGDVADATADLVDAQRLAEDPLRESERSRATVLDTNHPMADVLADAERALGGARPAKAE